MSGRDPFVGQIILTPYNFAPTGFAFCHGQLIAISQNTALFSLLGTTYGGNGISTFALPNLQGRVPISPGQGPGLSDYVLGQEGGEELVILNTTELPIHTHVATTALTATMRGRNEEGNQQSPAGNVPATESAGVTATYSDASPASTMRASAVALTGAPAVLPAGSSQGHENRQPFLVLNYCIATAGIFPSRQ